MAGNRLVFLALALLAGWGRDKGGAHVTDNPNRDLQRPTVDASSPLNDHAAKASTKPGSVGKAPQGSSKAMTWTLAKGTAISARFDDAISSRTHKAGYKLTGTVSSDVKDKSGRIVIPAGSKVHLTIAAIHESERKSDKTGKLVLKPSAVVIGSRSYRVAGSGLARGRTLKDRTTNAADLAKIGAGAGAGALLGTAVSGGSTKGAVIGGALGAAVGT